MANSTEAGDAAGLSDWDLACRTREALLQPAQPLGRRWHALMEEAARAWELPDEDALRRHPVLCRAGLEVAEAGEKELALTIRRLRDAAAELSARLRLHGTLDWLVSTDHQDESDTIPGERPAASTLMAVARLEASRIERAEDGDVAAAVEALAAARSAANRRIALRELRAARAGLGAQPAGLRAWLDRQLAQVIAWASSVQGGHPEPSDESEALVGTWMDWIRVDRPPSDEVEWRRHAAWRNWRLAATMTAAAARSPADEPTALQQVRAAPAGLGAQPAGLLGWLGRQLAQVVAWTSSPQEGHPEPSDESEAAAWWHAEMRGWELVLAARDKRLRLLLETQPAVLSTASTATG